MASLKWYVNRLRRMSPIEVYSRVHALVKQKADDDLIRRGLIPGRPGDVGEAQFHLPLVSVEEFETYAPIGAFERLVQQADDACDNVISYFDRDRQSLGEPANWHRDWHNDVDSPVTLSSGIDYRDVPSAGDCKQVWEPNRHHQFVVIARAYRATGRHEYADRLIELMLQWISSNPYGHGMNWRSPLELGVRAINWVVALDLIRDSGAFRGEAREAILDCLYLHCWDMARKFSPGSSANNHVIGEAAGVYVVGRYWPELVEDKWLADARSILLKEIQDQVHDDGGTAEQAINYELFVIQFFTIVGLAAERSGDDLGSRFWQQLGRQHRFIESIAELGSPLPFYGDQDDGYVLDLGAHQHDASSVIALGRALRDGVSEDSPPPCEAALWLLGSKHSGFTDMACEPVAGSLRVFKGSGQVQMQGDNWGLLFDTAELGYGPLAAHGHCDGLQVLLYVDGSNWLVDPGTYDYFSYPKWRAHLKSTRAHNTLCIDGLNQSEILGAFMFGKRADTQLLHSEESGGRMSATGRLTGYLGLPQQTAHTRSVSASSAGDIMITDDVICPGTHEIALHFHIAPGIEVIPVGTQTFELRRDSNIVRIEFPADMTCENLSDEFMRAYSPRYHVREEGSCLAAYCSATNSGQWQTHISVNGVDREA
ncbi:MAG: heparinase II/III family protein [Pseudomonadaceae bacterium]|nr:heparinase II/III family protein [Pseudomonadaceae bacterium]